MEQNLISNIDKTGKVIEELGQTKEELSVVENELFECQS